MRRHEPSPQQLQPGRLGRLLHRAWPLPSVAARGPLATGAADSGDLYTISKIYKEDPTASTFTSLGHEDRFRIVLDKNIPFAGTTTTNTVIIALLYQAFSLAAMGSRPFQVAFPSVSSKLRDRK